jgi:hypothetical protein
MTKKVVNLFAGDTRCVRLIDQLFEAIKDSAVGLPIPSIIGCLELVKMQVLTDEDFHAS